MVKKRGLGRGLDALLGGAKSTPTPTDGHDSDAIQVELPVDGVLKTLPVDLIQRGKYQPRRDMQQEALEELADSIKAQGVMQPIVVRGVGDGRYEIIAGERRWRATQLAGLDAIPAVVRDVTDDVAVALALIENIQREDLNPIEEAHALNRLKTEFELTHQEVANAVGKSRTAVTNLLRLMTLPNEVCTLIEHGDIEMGHARAILGLASDKQLAAATHVVSKGFSVRQTEAYVRSLQNPKPAKPMYEASADIRRLEQDLSEKIGVPVNVQHGSKGKGKLVLSYNSLDELDGILSHIR